MVKIEENWSTSIGGDLNDHVLGMLAFFVLPVFYYLIGPVSGWNGGSIEFRASFIEDRQ